MPTRAQVIAALQERRQRRLSKPASRGGPRISGTTQQGQTLTSSRGFWDSLDDAQLTFAFQWKRNGGDIGGATSSTYVLQAADAGTTITVLVTATNGNGSTSAISAGVGPIT